MRLQPLLLLSGLVVPGSATGPVELWVAPATASAGAEALQRAGWSGTDPGQPLQGLVRAQAAAREALRTPEGRSRGVTVTLCAGQYFNTSLKLTEQDGTAPGAAGATRVTPAAPPPAASSAAC